MPQKPDDGNRGSGNGMKRGGPGSENGSGNESRQDPRGSDGNMKSEIPPDKKDSGGQRQSENGQSQPGPGQNSVANGSAHGKVNNGNNGSQTPPPEMNSSSPRMGGDRPDNMPGSGNISDDTGNQNGAPDAVSSATTN